MRIARVLTRLNLGGPARQVLASDPVLGERGHDVRVFCGRPLKGEGDLTATLRSSGTKVVIVPGLGREPGVARDLRAWHFLRRELLKFEPDIVHTHASKAGLLGRLAAPRRAARVHTFHGHVLEGYFSRPVGWALARLERQLALRTDMLVAVSRATRADLVRLGVATADRIALSPPGIRLEEFLERDPSASTESQRTELGVPSNAFVVALVGRLAPVKQPELAGRVLARLVELCVDAQLVVVGDGPGRAALLEAAGRAAPRVVFAGAVECLAPLVAACDALLSCSRNEGLPVAIIEAAALARPVVALDVGGIAEVVTHNETGRLVAAVGTHTSQADALAQNLAELAHDRALARRLGLAARERARSFSATALADRLETIYRDALAAHRGGVFEVHTCGS